MTVIKNLRKDRGLAPDELAASAGVSLEEYYDLEDHEDELHIAASVATVARVAQALGVRPSTFYAGTSSGTITGSELARRISEHLARTGKPLGELEENVGWDLAAALEAPARFLDLPADGLRDICSPLGVNWLEVLDGIAVSPAPHVAPPPGGI